MSNNRSIPGRWLEVHEAVRSEFPHLFGVFSAEDEFISLLIKVRPDGTCLAVLKRYGPDGAPVVCFGSGYGAVGALLAVDGSAQGGNWRVDKPWGKNGK